MNTSIIQPLDQCIIKISKTYYGSDLRKKGIDMTDCGELKKITILDVLYTTVNESLE